MAVYFSRSDGKNILPIDSVTRVTIGKNPVFVRRKGPSPVVNLLLLGKVGVGKARIINETFRMNVFECGAVTEVIQGVSQREEVFFASGGNTYRVKIYDTMGIGSQKSRIKISNTMSAIKKYVTNIYPDGINMILLVYRHGDFGNAERKRLLYILRRLNKDSISLITGLIITGCANKNDSARRKIVSEFDSNFKTQAVGRYVLQGTHVVGFTNLSNVSDAMTEMYKAVNYRDGLHLRKVIEHCNDRQQMADMFFYHGHFYKGFCEFPWQLCPCYDWIYTCWRWGYTLDECLHIEESDDLLD